MENSEYMWAAEKCYYSNVATSIVNRKIWVMDAIEKLGYTRNGSVIYVAKEHPLYEKLSEKDIHMVRFGICVHETLHQVFTNFDYLNQYTTSLMRAHYFLNSFDMEMFHTIQNLIEDPAIENMAPQVLGGNALRALDFTIAKLDEVSGRFDEGCQYSYQELINALVQFGDLGILHGSFKFDNARNRFLEIAPLFYEAINEPDSKKRIEMATPIHLACRTLWEHYSNPDQLLELLKSYLKKMNKENHKNSGFGNGRNGMAENDSRKNGKRKITIKRVSKEDYEKALQDSGKSLQQDDGISDIEVVICDDTKEKVSRGQNPLVGDGQNTGVEKNSPGEINASAPMDDGEKKTREENTYREKSDRLATRESPGNDEQGVPQSEDEDIPPSISLEDYDSIMKCIENEYESIAAEQLNIEQYYSDLPDYAEQMREFPEFNHTSVLNTYIHSTEYENTIIYDGRLEELSCGIETMVGELKNIFVADRVKRHYTDSGKVNLKRIASGKVTTRLFSKKNRPAEKSNLCVGILNDNSGSTDGEKIDSIITTNISLAEVFGHFGIPVYSMGFRSTDYHDAEQTHYIRWENSRFERERLLSMKALGCNFDSYSIRYLTQLLSERQEKHKLMIINSDGIPSHYFTGEEGITQNASAINSARAIGIDVLGIGVGTDISTDNFVRMYQDMFMHVNRPEDLFDHIAEKIITIVNGW